jgi:hypothetical protein
MKNQIVIPEIHTLPQYFHQLAPIVGTNYGKNWYLNNYLLLFATHDYFYNGGVGLAFRENLWCINMPLHESNRINLPPYIEDYMVINDFSLLFNPVDVVEKYKLLLASGYYLIVNIDRNCVNPAFPYGTIHDALIYGYDEDSFLLVDYVDTNSFIKKTTLSFSDMIQIHTNTYELPFYISSLNRIVAYRVKSDNEYTYDFNLSLFKQSLVDYYNGCNTIDDFDTIQRLEPKQIVWGIECYDELDIYLKTTKDFLDYRNFCILKEHKTSLCDTITHVMDIHNIDSENIIIKLAHIKELSNICLKLCLKYNITQNYRLKDTIHENLLMIRKQESKLISELLSYI